MPESGSATPYCLLATMLQGPALQRQWVHFLTGEAEWVHLKAWPLLAEYNLHCFALRAFFGETR